MIQPFPQSTSSAFQKNFIFFVLAFFLHSGLLKSDVKTFNIGIDLTLLSSGLLFILVIWSYLKNCNLGGGSRTLFILLFVGIIIPGIILSPKTEYGHEKSLYFITLGVLSFAAGLEFAQEERWLYLFLKWSALFSLLIVINSLQKLIQIGGNIDRLTAFGADTIALGREAGFLFLVCGIFYFTENINVYLKLFLLLVAIGAAIDAVMAGSKGPIIAALFSLLLAIRTRLYSKNIFRIILLGVVISCCLMFIWKFVPAGSMAKLQKFANAEAGGGDKERWRAVKTGIQLSFANPLGLGWGGFQGYIPTWVGEARQHPHNFLVEFFVEGGWVAGMGLLWLLAQARANAKKFLPQVTYLVWGAFMFFSLSNALVSGDVNDNRLVYVLLGMGLGMNQRHMKFHDSTINIFS